MWKYARLLLPLIFIVFVFPMIMKGPDGKPIMSPGDWLPDKNTLTKLQSQVAKMINKTSELATGEKLIVQPKKELFKWQDEKGNWHFTDNIHLVPDYAKAQFETEQMPQVVNTMAAPVIKKDSGGATQGPSMLLPSGQVDLKKIPEIVDEAKKAKAAMEQRNAALEDI